jgi:hypothetical protein
MKFQNNLIKCKQRSFIPRCKIVVPGTRNVCNAQEANPTYDRELQRQRGAKFQRHVWPSALWKTKMISSTLKNASAYNVSSEKRGDKGWRFGLQIMLLYVGQKIIVTVVFEKYVHQLIFWGLFHSSTHNTNANLHVVTKNSIAM